jgi:calcium-dependent protein kinase
MGACFGKTGKDSKRRRNISYLEQCKRSDSKNFLSEVTSVSGIHAKYKFLDIIGIGSFGKIMKAQNKSDKTHLAAIKTIPKSKIDKSHYSKIMQEIKVLRMVDHQNIVKYYETYEDSKYIYIVMEHCSGGELFDKILQRGVFPEIEAKKIMEKLLEAINHCHYNGIVHRDLKPENIMYASNDSKAEIKIIDFGFSKSTSTRSSCTHFPRRVLSFHHPHTNPPLSEMSPKQSLTKFFQDLHLQSIVGSPYYVAPEVFDGAYGKECDIWSLGIILHILISGTMPFAGENQYEIIEGIKSGEKELTFEGSAWQGKGEEVKDLLRKLLQVDRTQRLTASEALRHEWFLERRERKRSATSAVNGENGATSNGGVVKKGGRGKVDVGIIERLRKYRGSSGLQKAVMNVLVKRLNEGDIRELRKGFKKIDSGQTGLISAEDLEGAIREHGLDIPADEIGKIIQTVDYYGNGEINYSEFLSATISTKHFLTEERMWSLFKYFDADDSNYITAENIKDTFDKEGKNFTGQEIAEMVSQHNTERNGRICFSEFKVMIQSVTDEDIDFRTATSSFAMTFETQKSTD